MKRGYLISASKGVNTYIQMKEEEAVKELSKEYMKNGFTFKEAGVLDNVEVQADNGNKLYVTLSPEDAKPDEVKREAKRLQSFLEENKLEEEDPDYHKKWQEKHNVYINAARVTPQQTIEIEDQVQDEFDSDGSFWDRAKKYYNTMERGVAAFRGHSVLPTIGEPSKEAAVVQATQQLQAEDPDKDHSKEEIIKKEEKGSY